MQFFSLFIIAAVLIGTGAMLAPAWSSKAPRMGLAASFSLAIIVGGAVWWAELFGWDTLVIDYLLFGLVSLVVLTGTMSLGTTNNDEAWISRIDIAFLALVGLLCALPLFVLNLPLGTHAASEALISLAARDGGTFTSLAPYYPDVIGFAPPGFHALAAYLSQQLRQPIPTIHMAIGAITAFLTIWTVFDLGSEIQDKRLGRAMALAALVSLGVMNLLWQSYYSQLMGVLFTFAFISYALRYYRHHKLLDMIAAGLLLGAIAYLSPMLFIITAIVYYLCLFLSLLPIRRQASKEIAQWTIYTRLGLWLGIALVCIFGIGFWWIKNNPWCALICSDHRFFTDEVAGWGMGLYTILATILAGYVFHWLYEKLPSSLQSIQAKYLYGALALALITILGASLYVTPNIPQAATENDLAAFAWIAENTEEDSLILNYSMNRYISQTLSDEEIFISSDWLTIMSNRASVYIPISTCLQMSVGSSCRREEAIRDFWTSPSQSINLLSDYSIDYILVPDGLDFPQNIEGLDLVFEQGGAKVYQVIP